ncbi:MAG TPA: NADH/ubiquinone/plastoquinone (complex I) [Candidatus Cloacimonetes bacterium]|nr:NADH/ubiquinone/plastoquinone (complex I) [Candidatus Cloacimonadota bacterium]HEX38102.1 NADH/ubiquinone/plastoquinone (complex I) [Candidatus Cloacimonadota bacterium]
MILSQFIFVPLLAAFLIVLFARKKENVAAIIALAACAWILIVAVIGFLKLPAHGGLILENTSGWKIPYTIALVLDNLSSFMLIVVSLIGFLSAFYSVQYLNHFNGKWNFFALFMLMMTGMNGVILTGDFFNLFVFMEISLYSAYALVAFGTESEELEAAFKYALMGAITSTMILFGIGILYSYTSTLTMADVGLQLSHSGTPKLLFLVYGLFIAGFGLKTALVPFHAWLPDAHPSAPAPISAMLSGVLIKTLGVYAIVRIFFNVFGAPTVVLQILMLLAILSIVIGGFLSIVQWDFKRLLGFSSISQIGYVVLGFALGTPLGILGGILHLFYHAIFKSLLFMDSGAVEYATDTRDLRQLGGLSKEMKVTSSTTMVGTLSIAGIPPFNGFFSKLIIIIACIQAGRVVLGIIAALVSIVTLAYFLKVQKHAFYGKKGSAKVLEKVPLAMKAVMIVLAALCLLSSLIMIPPIREKYISPIVDTVRGKTSYIQNIEPYFDTGSIK